MKGSTITGPVGKEAADLWPVSFFKVIRLHEYFGVWLADSV